jgi:NADH:ubiquinone oxidoreductase subunit B-like Fe-S oxidoreductase
MGELETPNEIKEFINRTKDHKKKIIVLTTSGRELIKWMMLTSLRVSPQYFKLTCCTYY